MRKFRVFGDPIVHSLSPQIHQLFAAQAGIKIEYTKTRTADFLPAIEAFKHSGGLGANVSVPHKIAAFEYADNLSDRAQIAGAVNTLHFTDDGVFGDNTDGIGLFDDLTTRLQIKLADKRLLIVGAGGAARGVLPNLLAADALISLANRSQSKAEAIAQNLSQYGTIHPLGLDEISGSFDVIINATATGLTADDLALSGEIVHADTVCYDLMYSKQPTPFMQWGIDHGAGLVADGLGMLVGQAAHAFNLWNQFMPDTKPVLDVLR